MKNHIALILTQASGTKWIIRDGVSSEVVGVLTFEGILSESYCEIRSFGPFRDGSQIGSAWSSGNVVFRTWMNQTLHDLFNAKQFVVRGTAGESKEAIAYFEERVQ